MVGVDFHDLFSLHPRVLVAAESLGRHDTLHVGGVAVLAGHKDAGRGGEPVGDLDFRHLARKLFLEPFREVLVVFFSLLPLFLGCFALGDFHAFFGNGNELDAVEFGDLVENVLVERVDHEHDLNSLASQPFDEGGVYDRLLALSCDVVDVFLGLRHVLDVLLKGDELAFGLGGFVSDELSELFLVRTVLENTQLDALAELLVEVVIFAHLLGLFFLVVFGVFILLIILVLILFAVVRHLPKEGDGLARQLLAHHTQHFALLKSLT
mmetsp:Transcript_25436/g.45198  ORF Transcript_25436/g.45198 Transcript_25436/m.45198 type:complete len:266 (-) Transcript_25436:1375-2172(-)